MLITSSALARTIADVADKLGAPLPPGYTAAVSVGRALPTAADALSGGLAELHGAVLDALAAGADPADDTTVQRLAIHRALADSGIRQAADQRANSDIRAAIAEFSDAIIEVWADTIRDDLDSLTRIANELYLPDLQAADHTALRHRGQLNMWADASSAAERADLAVRGVDAILTALAVNTTKAHRPLLLAPDLGPVELDSIPPAASAWSVARTGATLRLAGVGEYMAAVGRITAERRARQAQADADRLANQQASRGVRPTTIGKATNELIG